MFDLTKRDSFDTLPEWHKTIVDSCDPSVVISLVGSRCDLPNRAVSYEEARQYAEKNNFNYLEVSAKTG